MQLLNAANSLLLVVDIQEKLLPTIQNCEEMLKHCAWLIRLANTVEVPIFISEQYPQGLGSTAASLRELAPAASVQAKLEFSCVANADMFQAIEAYQREQIVLCGIETHVCLLHTAFDLANRGKQVFVVVDATSTRYPEDKKFALKRMSHHPNIQIVTREMVLFEWVQRSGTPLFKEVSQKFLREN
ncbi:MAG: hydrolase [Gammaproteobacteria bacterium]